MRLKKIVLGGTAVAALGLAAMLGTGTAFAATPAPPSQIGSVAPATGTAADPAESGTASATESTSKSAAAADGPGGHADPVGQVDHQFDGQE